MFYRGDTRVRFATAIVLLLSMLLLLPWLGETWFNSKGEPREAIVAVTMLQSGDWVLPLSFGSDMPYKPPLLAWMIAAAAWLFNGGVVNEYLSRLPSALAAIALIMAGFAWARRERGDRFAIVMSIVTLTCFEVFRAAMACRVDMVLTACMVIPVYILYRIREDRRGKGKFVQWLAAWALLTGAVLAKGPVGSLLPCMAMGIFFLFRGERFFPTLLRMLSLALAAMLLPAVWYYAAWLRGGDAFLDLMLEENIGRLTGQMSYESHEQPFYYNFITLIAGCLPWTLMVLMAATTLRKARRTPLKPAGMLALTVAVAVVAFYCIPSSKRSVYLLPAYPFVCYAIASIADSETARRPGHRSTAGIHSIIHIPAARAAAGRASLVRMDCPGRASGSRNSMDDKPPQPGRTPAAHRMVAISGIYRLRDARRAQSAQRQKPDTDNRCRCRHSHPHPPASGRQQVPPLHPRLLLQRPPASCRKRRGGPTVSAGNRTPIPALCRHHRTHTRFHPRHAHPTRLRPQARPGIRPKKVT